MMHINTLIFHLIFKLKLSLPFFKKQIKIKKRKEKLKAKNRKRG
jgi:hypothetical protein